MNDRRFDDVVRAVAAAGGGKASRRAVLRALGLGGAAAFAGLPRPATSSRAAAASTFQDATPAAGPVKERAPGGPTVADTAFALAFDVEAIFRFVADEVHYDAYAGALRGAKGTLWGMAGNSVDQALLLAALLEQALVTTRFAVGSLADEEADSLLDSMRIDAATARARRERLGAAPGVPGGDPVAPTPEQEQEQVARPDPGRRQRLLETARTQLDDDLGTIAAALAAADVAPEQVAPSLPERERRQHVWVQYADGPLWIDLDPSLPDAVPGTAYATVDETLDALPDELYHGVTIRAVAEVVAGGQPTEQEVLTYQARSVDLVGVPLTFGHAPPETLKALGASVLGGIAGTVQYVPVLLAGEAGETGSPISFVTGEGVLDVFGESSNEGDALAEWLEIEVFTPDGEPRRIVREVFDRIGVERRAAGGVDVATLPPIKLVEVPDLGHVFLPMQAASVIGVVGQAVPGGYFVQDYAVDDPSADLALALHGYHSARDALQLEIAADHGYRWYPDEPNLTAITLTPVEITADGGTLSSTIDLLHQGFGFVPLTGSTPDAHPRVVAGVLSHVAERLATEGAAAELADLPPTAFTSVGRVFEEARREGLAIRTLQPGSGETDGLDVSGQAKTRIADALAAGFVVVVPERAVELNGGQVVGWWQVDPRTGKTVDLMENGQGMATPIGDRIVLFQVGRYLVTTGALRKLAACVAALAFGAAWAMWTLDVANGGGLGSVVAAGASGVGGVVSAVLCGGGPSFPVVA